MLGYINGGIREVRPEEALITGLKNVRENKKLYDLIESTKGKSFGVFTTVMIKDNVPVFLDEHLDNVLRDARDFNKILRYDGEEVMEEYDKTELEKRVSEVIQANKESDYATHIQIRKEKGLIIDPFERKYSDEDFEEGVKAEFVPWRRENPEIKEIRPWDVYEMEMYLKIAGVSEILYCDEEEEFVFEGGRSNLFIVKDGTLITPSNGIFRGTTRQKVLEIARDNRIPVEERSIEVSEMRDADKVFLTGSVKGILSVTLIDGTMHYDVGELTREIREPYDKMVLDYIYDKKRERNLV